MSTDNASAKRRANDINFEGKWFIITVKTDAVALDLVNLFKQYVVPYFFGSMHVQLNEAQVKEIQKLFNSRSDKLVELLEDPIRDPAWLVTQDAWDFTNEEYTQALLKNNYDEKSDIEFYKQFLGLFEIDSRGAIKVQQSMHSKITLFAIRFAHKIKSLSGLQCCVPRLTKNVSQNKIEMFKMFISVYPAYFNLCKNNNYQNDFYWKFLIDEEGETDPQQITPNNKKQKK